MDAPWVELVEAEARLTEAQRGDDKLAVASAAAAVESAKVRCGAFFAEMFLYAASHDDLRTFLVRLLDGLEPADAEARRLVDAATDDVRELKEENWAMAQGIADLQRRVEQLERSRDGSGHSSACSAGDGHGEPGRGWG
jgi:hypothetical protein